MAKQFGSHSNGRDEIVVETDHLYAGGYVGAPGAHVTFYDKIGDTPVRVNLDADQTIELIKLLASTLKVN